jgi:hypothetical protein
MVASALGVLNPDGVVAVIVLVPGFVPGLNVTVELFLPPGSDTGGGLGFGVSNDAGLPPIVPTDGVPKVTVTPTLRPPRTDSGLSGKNVDEFS